MSSTAVSGARVSALTLSLLASVAALSLTSHANAQEAQSPGFLGTLYLKSETPAAEEDGVVPKTSTAGSKVPLEISRTPQTVSVVTGQELAQRQADNSTEALRYSAGVNSELYGSDPRSDWIRVRGFHAPEYLDGLKLARGTFAWPRVDPYFAERYEVLRGPAGSLYGQTPPGGLVNLVSKRPTEETLRQVGLQFGNQNRTSITGDFGGKLTEDGRLSYRLTAKLRQSDTQVDFVQDNRKAIAGALTWKIGSATELTLLAQTLRDDAGSAQFLPSQGTVFPSPNGELPINLFTGEPDYDKFVMEQQVVGYDLTHDFANGLRLSHKLRWSEVDYALNVVRGIGMVPASDTMLNRRATDIYDLTRAMSTDTNLSFGLQTGAVQHDVLVGLDHRNQTSDFKLDVGLVAPLDIYNPTYGATVTPFTTIFNTTTEMRQTGIYIQDSIEVGNLNLLLTARNDWYDLETTDNGASPATKTKNDGSEFTWRAGAVYSFDNGVSVYGSHATSFAPLAGLNTTTGAPLEPTKSRQSEVGVKYAPAGRNALVTLSAFDLLQENTVVNNGTTVSQVGESRTKGIELEARAAFDNGWALGGSVARLDTEITVGTAAQQGNRLPFVPDLQASLWASYDFGGSLDWLTIGGGIRHAGSSYGSTANTIKTGNFTVADLNMSFDLDKVLPGDGARFDLSIANITNEKYVTTCDNADACYWGAERTIRGALIFDF